ncbi:MAG: hypothetical protein KDA21_14920, partial [Phycisphaerales bacterium]|nr:hypothetical protein [Phycisphaerales bacterium]
VRNDGGQAVTGAWTDSVRLSTDPVAGNDVVLSDFTFIGTLNPGETYMRSEAVSLPLDAADSRWVVVVTDAPGVIDEGTGEVNNALVDDMAIDILSPDLVVADIVAPGTAVVGDEITVDWTIRNDGGVAATGTWTDEILQSGDAAAGGDTVLATFQFTGTLAPGETYTQSEQVTLSPNGSGSQWIVVRTDRQNDVAEGLGEANNISVDDVPVDVSAPDLLAISITAPATASVRDAVEVSWEVRNDGDVTIDGSWSDELFISADAAAGGDTSMGSFGYSGTLNPGETYTQTRTVVLPASAVNQRWFVVRTDSGNDINEGSNEGNNAYVDDVPISISGPDLVVQAFNAPSAAVFGAEVMVDWIGRNDGSEDTIGNWTDAVYLSTDAAFDSGDRLLRGEPVAASPVAPAGTYAKSATFTLPLDGSTLDGTYYMIIRANAGGTLIETSSANNVLASMPIEIARPTLPNLVVSDIQIPAPVGPNLPVNVTWTVTNTGSAPVSGQSWGETLYISADANIGSDTITAARAYTD